MERHEDNPLGIAGSKITTSESQNLGSMPPDQIKAVIRARVEEVLTMMDGMENPAAAVIMVVEQVPSHSGDPEMEGISAETRFAGEPLHMLRALHVWMPALMKSLAQLALQQQKVEAEAAAATKQ